jgi:hypothetical protein
MTRLQTNRRVGWCLAAAIAIALASPTARASDGAAMVAPPPDGSAQTSLLAAAPAAATPTYYESAVGTDSVQALETTDPTLPTQLAIDDATAVATYRATATNAARTVWQLRIDGFARRHEHVDAIYDMVLVLALPELGGRDAFEPAKRGFVVEDGDSDHPSPLVYGGENVVLKRNVGIEKSLLGQVTGPGGLPDLAGSGYRWTAWDTIMERDPGHDDTVKASGHLDYTTASGVRPPDPDDPRMAAYLITWIPELPASIPPFGVRMDVAPSAP